ncbi:MAG TPA: hypothetical protein DD738_05160 [Ruminiclostridium sp.]|nr:hypothetical protein [Ruminiclostridium sp.]
MDDYGLDWAQEEYDRQEPQEGDVVGTCAYCGRDIYGGEKVYVIDGDWYCTACVTEAIADEEGPPDEY